MSRPQKTHTRVLRGRRAVHRLRAEAAAARRAAERVGAPVASLTPLTYAEIHPTPEEPTHAH
jgi:hypothetical protein